MMNNETKDNPLDEIYPQYKMSELRNTVKELKENNEMILSALKSSLERLENKDEELQKAKSKNAVLERYLKRIDHALEENEMWRAEDVLYTWRGYK